MEQRGSSRRKEYSTAKRGNRKMEFIPIFVIERIIKELKREIEKKNSTEYKNGISAALLIIFSTIKQQEEKENE